MNARFLKYILVYITPAVVFLSLNISGLWSFFAIVFLFGLLPLLELFSTGSTDNLSEVEEEMARIDFRYDWLLYSLVPIQYFTLFYFLYLMSDSSLPFLSRVGMISAMGMSCGILGINAAHELGHRNTWYERFMSKSLLLTTLYMHFFIEHNRGHHNNVSTDEDPASAKLGEWIYMFYIRTIVGGWISAWRLEKERLTKSSLSFWSFNNEMFNFQLIQLLFLLLVYLVFGMTVLLSFLAAAFVGIMLLETVNYIEHYGLRRIKVNNRYERTLPVHSWNSNHPIGRLVLLELSRHSDHHYKANRKYQILRHFDDSPQMPTGYPGMMIIALLPPLWFWLMHSRIRNLDFTNDSDDQNTIKIA